MRRTSILLALLFWALSPAAARADVSNVVFISQPQSIAPGAVSGTLTLGAQDANDNPVAGGIPQTGCIALTSSSATGQFSSSAAAWNPVSVLTMNKGTSNRNFYYQDQSSGTYSITALFALKPTTVSDSCATWPQTEWGSTFTATQQIVVGSADSSPNTPQSSVPDTATGSTSSPQATSALTQQIISAPTTVGSETLKTTIKTEPVVMVGGGSFFTASASDSSGTKVGDVRYLWNFGDGATYEGQTAFHTYAYPGSYVVNVMAAAGNEAGLGRATVRAIPAQVGLLAESDGSVVLSNQASQEINIGLWSINSGTSTFSIPQDTILLGGASVRFAPSIMQMMAGVDAVLKYPNNTIAATVFGEPPQKPSLKEPKQKDSEEKSGLPGAGDPRTFSQELSAKAPTKSSYPESAAVAGGAASMVPIAVGVLGLILIGVGLYFTKLRKAEVTIPASEEFNIEG